MKRCLLIAAVLLIGLASCHRNKISDTDLVIVNQGQLSFYDVETQELTPYEKETDSVVNLLFDDNNHLYYTVANQDKLTLKMLDLNDASPAPKKCADWNMTIEEGADMMTGEASNLLWDSNKERIIMYKLDFEEFFMKPVVYEPQTGKVRELAEDENYNIYHGLNISRFYEENHNLYYATPEGSVCLTDLIPFTKYFEDLEDPDDLCLEPCAISPDGKRLVYSVIMLWGEGWGYYGFANLDGSSQRLLKDSDIWFATPAWLADGSLVYVGQTERPKNDPAYSEWNPTQPCIMLLGPDNKATQLSLGKLFAVKPYGEKKETVELQGNLEGCDVAIFDNGQVTFYNSTTEKFVPFVHETDSVINGVFVLGDEFFYTVAIGDELYLKKIYMSEYSSYPTMCTDWNLKRDDCVSETYGKASTLVWIPAFDRVGISHNFSWDFYNFADIKFYNIYKNVKTDGWSEDEDTETDIYDEEFMKYEADIERFTADEGQYYYLTEDSLEICLTDKINFEDYVSDPSYYEEPEFCFYSIDPTRTRVAYSAIIEWGDLGHGPLCVSSLDGKVQVAFRNTDAADLTWGWLPNGSLLYVGDEGIMIVHPDGREELFSASRDFVVSTK